jgi:hypothetical protein
MPKFKIDFSDVESRGGKKGSAGRRHYPPGDYAVKCTKAEIIKSSEKGTPGLALTFKILQGEHQGGELSDRLWLTPKSLWRVRQTLEAMGMKVPSKAVQIDTSSFVGKSLAVTLDDEEYEEKIYSRVVDTFLLADLEGLESDEDAGDLSDDEDAEETTTEADEDLEGIDLDDL